MIDDRWSRVGGWLSASVCACLLTACGTPPDASTRVSSPASAPAALPAGAALGNGAAPAAAAAAVTPADITPLSDGQRARWRAAFILAPLPPPTLSGNDARTRALRAAFVPYRRGDYAAAAAAFDSIRLDAPDDATAALYLGICRLYQDEIPNALELLRGIPGTATPAQMAEASWYGLVGISRLRDPSAARPEAEALCRGGGPASARACAAVAALGPDSTARDR
jgi:hypothetical protein